jgi:hypothetical protein
LAGSSELHPLSAASARHFAAAPAFGEIMLRQAAPPAAVQGSQAKSVQTVSEPSQAEPAEELAASAKNADQASETPQTNFTVRTPQAGSQPVPARASEEPSGSAGPSVPLAPAAEKSAMPVAARTPQNAAKSVTPPKPEKPASSSGSAAPAPETAAPRPAGTSAAPPPKDAKAADFPVSGDGVRAETAASLAGTQPPAATPPPAAKPIEVPPQHAVSAPTAANPTARAGSQMDRSSRAAGAETRNEGREALPAPAVNAAGARAPQFPAAVLRSAAGAVISSANGAGKPAAPIPQPAMIEAPTAAGPVSPILHGLRSGPAAIALPSSNNSTVSAAFARMDSAAPPQVLESAPQRLSVGVRDSGLGWVEIRTHAAAGQVSAVLATGSNEAHAALQAQIPELRDYLAGHEVRVDQLLSERFSPSGGGRDPAPQQEGRNPSSRGSGAPAAQLPPSFGEGAEESLSYINVRV